MLWEMQSGAIEKTGQWLKLGHCVQLCSSTQ